MVCASHNAHLAFVDDKDENTFIKGLVMQEITGGESSGIVTLRNWEYLGFSQLILGYPTISVS